MYRREMSETEPAVGKTWQYRFTQPGDVEVETREFAGDEAAEAYARELSKSKQVPIIIHRFLGHVDWEYVDEVDERR
jgi:hypothetical protein